MAYLFLYFQQFGGSNDWPGILRKFFSIVGVTYHQKLSDSSETSEELLNPIYKNSREWKVSGI